MSWARNISRAVRQGADALPVLLPVLDPPIAPDEILAQVDGLLFTGSPSNVAPRHYGGAAPRPGVMQDEHRDATALPLLKAAIAAGKAGARHLPRIPGGSTSRSAARSTSMSRKSPVAPIIARTRMRRWRRNTVPPMP